MKQFMRGLFQITTGDKDDADYTESDNSVETVNMEEIEEMKALIQEAGLEEEYILKRAKANRFEDISARLYRSKAGMRSFLLKEAGNKTAEEVKQ
jgi:hypothetical protein